MTERERLEREIYQLTAIINADVEALARKSTSDSDRAGLLRQIDIRAAKRHRLRALLSASLTAGESATGQVTTGADGGDLG